MVMSSDDHRRDVSRWEGYVNRDVVVVPLICFLIGYPACILITFAVSTTDVSCVFYLFFVYLSGDVIFLTGSLRYAFREPR